MIEVQIFIPVNDNDGKSFSQQTDDAFEARLIALFGGFSLLPGLVKGGWSHEGSVFRDNSRIYMIHLFSICDGGKIRQAVTYGKKRYAQINIFVRYLGIAEIL